MRMAPGSAGIAEAGCNVRVTDAVLLALFGSRTAELTLAVFVNVPPAAGVVMTTVKAADAPLLKVAREHVTVVVPAHGEVAETSVVPGGSTSVRTTAVATDGPALVIVIVYG